MTEYSHQNRGGIIFTNNSIAVSGNVTSFLAFYCSLSGPAEALLQTKTIKPFNLIGISAYVAGNSCDHASYLSFRSSGSSVSSLTIPATTSGMISKVDNVLIPSGSLNNFLIDTTGSGGAQTLGISITSAEGEYL